MPRPVVDVRRSADRFRTSTAGLDIRHSFSAGRHYDPANTAHGVLVLSDEIVVSSGAGFGLHDHRDVEVVTWVLSGALAHEDSTGHSGVVRPGVVQRMSAGTGVRHAERNAAVGPAGEPVHLVQMWVVPECSGGTPDYEQRAVDERLSGGGLVPVVSGLPRHRDDAVPLSTRHAALHAARLQPGQAVELPDTAFVHLFVTRGGVELDDVGALDAGDAVRLTATGGHRLTAASSAEVLVWEMDAALGR